MTNEPTHLDRMADIVKQMDEQDRAALQCVEPQKLNEDGVYDPVIAPPTGRTFKSPDMGGGSITF